MRKRNTREIFSNNTIYKTDSISHLPSDEKHDFGEELVRIYIATVNQLINQMASPKILDIGCATGQHLSSFSKFVLDGYGADFSFPFLERAESLKKEEKKYNLHYICSDARELPFPSNRFDIVYSFASLYGVPDLDKAILEIGRILKPGGRAAFDLGNSFSINNIVVNVYPDITPSFISITSMRKLIKIADLDIKEHRVFQILPYWATRPTWLKPLLWTGWKKFLERKIKGKMLDEFISSLPLFRLVSFRHLFVCQKA